MWNKKSQLQVENLAAGHCLWLEERPHPDLAAGQPTTQKRKNSTTLQNTRTRGLKLTLEKKPLSFPCPWCRLVSGRAVWTLHVMSASVETGATANTGRQFTQVCCPASANNWSSRENDRKLDLTTWGWHLDVVLSWPQINQENSRLIENSRRPPKGNDQYLT